jgi:hypothetical protein
MNDLRKAISTIWDKYRHLSLSCLACGHKKQFLDKVSYMLVHHDLLSVGTRCCVRRGTVVGTTGRPDWLCRQLARAMSTVLEIGSSKAGTGKRDRKSRYDVSFSFSSRLFDRSDWLLDSPKGMIVVQPFIRFVGPQIQIRTR